MGRLLKFLFGLAIGAGTALLVTPKTGREVREMLAGPQVRGLMPARLAELTRPRDQAQPSGADAATAVAEPPTWPEPVAEAEPEMIFRPVPVVAARTGRRSRARAL